MTENLYNIDILGKTISVHILKTGDGINALISGGERPHIGSVSIKLPENPLITHEFPRHKEGRVSSKWAEALCSKYAQAAVVSCGIHYDDLSMDQIQMILDALDSLLEDILKD